MIAGIPSIYSMLLSNLLDPYLTYMTFSSVIPTGYLSVTLGTNIFHWMLVVVHGRRLCHSDDNCATQTTIVQLKRWLYYTNNGHVTTIRSSVSLRANICHQGYPCFALYLSI